MSDGILTTKDYMNQKNIEGADNPVPSKKKNLCIDYKYRFPPAPLGKSQTTIKYKDKLMKLEMMDGVYEVPKKWSNAEKEKFHQFILVLGFEDVSVVISEKKPGKKAEKSKTMIYKIGHPDNGKDEKVNGSVTIKINKENQKFDCVNGMIVTEKKAVFDAFIKKGWYEISVEQKKED